MRGKYSRLLSISLLSLLISALSLGCTPAVDPGTPDTRTTAQKSLDALDLSQFSFPGVAAGQAPTSLTSSFVAPTMTADKAWKLSWSSSSTFISKIDPVSGQVFLNLPDPVPANSTLTLSVTATPAKASRVDATATTDGATKDFNFTVASDLTDQAMADAVATAVSGNLLDFSGADSASAVTGSFKLPKTGSFDSEITWAVTGDGVTFDQSTGKVTVTTPSGSAASTATLTPTVKKKKGATTVSPTTQPAAISISIPPVTPDIAVTKDLDALPDIVASALAATPASGNLSAITDGFALPVLGDRGTTLTWTSSDATVCTVAQTPTACTVAVSPKAVDTTVTLTADVTKPGTTSTTPTKGTVTVKVKGGSASTGTNYTITFDANTGTGTMTAQTVASAASATLSTNTYIAPTGKVLSGWNTVAAGTGTAYTAGATITGVTANLTLYAQWVFPVIYTVSFNSNTGSGTMASQTAVIAVALTLSTNTFTAPSGKTFGGWNTVADGTGTAYAAGATISAGLSSNMALYAQWGSTVAFNANTGTGTMASIVVSGTQATLPTSTFTAPTGKTFLGWSASSAASSTSSYYQAGTQVYASAVPIAYAQWGYLITFDANGGSGAAMAKQGFNPSYAYGYVGASVSTFTPPSATQEWGGWNTKADGSGVNGATENGFPSGGTTADVTLYAQWQPTWTASTVAGTVGTKGVADGSGTSASFQIPNAIAYDSANSCLYVAEYYKSGSSSYFQAIRKVTQGATPTVTTVLTSTAAATYFSEVQAMTFMAGKLYVYVYSSSSPNYRIYSIDPSNSYAIASAITMYGGVSAQAMTNDGTKLYIAQWSARSTQDYTYTGFIGVLAPSASKTNYDSSWTYSSALSFVNSMTFMGGKLYATAGSNLFSIDPANASNSNATGDMGYLRRDATADLWRATTSGYYGLANDGTNLYFLANANVATPKSTSYSNAYASNCVFRYNPTTLAWNRLAGGMYNVTAVTGGAGSAAYFNPGAIALGETVSGSPAVYVTDTTSSVIRRVIAP